MRTGREGKRPRQPQQQMVWCVVCIDESKHDTFHIFSTPEKAQAYCNSDPRMHITYDYVIDCPERMEQPTN